MSVTSYMETRALNESLFAHMHFYIVINFEQSIHCLVWQTWANNEWSSNVPQTRTASVSIHRLWGKEGGVSFHNTDGALQAIPFCITSSFFKVAVLAMWTMSKICSDQYLWVSLIKRGTNEQVLTKGHAIPVRVYSLYTLGYDVKTAVQSSDGAQRGALILVPALFHNK